VDGTQVGQLEHEVGSFADGDDMIDLAGAHPTGDAVTAQVAVGAVGGVDQLGEFRPAETTPSHSHIPIMTQEEK
jgi:hypothetical protein